MDSARSCKTPWGKTIEHSKMGKKDAVYRRKTREKLAMVFEINEESFRILSVEFSKAKTIGFLDMLIPAHALSNEKGFEYGREKEKNIRYPTNG
jgi:hypothetical protein